LSLVMMDEAAANARVHKHKLRANNQRTHSRVLYTPLGVRAD
jgi:hypothetical protein